MGGYKKKELLVGQKTLVDPDTGELIPTITQALPEQRDFNFHKVWLRHLIEALDDISNQKLRLAFFIIDHLDKENKLVMTQRTLAAKSGISIGTVTATMKILQENNFLRKINSGAYIVNPDMLFKGKKGARMAVLFDYSQAIKPQEENEDIQTEEEADEELKENEE